MNTNLIHDDNNPAKIDPERPFYVLMHKNQSHVYSIPTARTPKPYWTWDIKAAEMMIKILEKDFKCKDYVVIEGRKATALVCNKQAELEKGWKPIITEILKNKKDHGKCLELYEKGRKAYGPHPITADRLLKKFLGFLNQ